MSQRRGSLARPFGNHGKALALDVCLDGVDGVKEDKSQWLRVLAGVVGPNRAGLVPIFDTSS
jgi:hypothetical protein